MKIFTIGFTKKTAKKFFSELLSAKATRLVDVRLNNVSQLAGFTKREDLCYFIEKICNIPYNHLPELSPTQSMLDDYKKHNGSWHLYEQHFLNLMRERQIEKKLLDRY
jgi:uncharacterized protein (DUF488 family)